MIQTEKDKVRVCNIMGWATIDPHSQEEHSEIQKIPKFGVHQVSFDWDTAINKEIYDYHSVSMAKWLYLAYYWVYLHQTWGKT